MEAGAEQPSQPRAWPPPPPPSNHTIEGGGGWKRQTPDHMYIYLFIYCRDVRVYMIFYMYAHCNMHRHRYLSAAVKAGHSKCGTPPDSNTWCFQKAGSKTGSSLKSIRRTFATIQHWQRGHDRGMPYSTNNRFHVASRLHLA